MYNLRPVGEVHEGISESISGAPQMSPSGHLLPMNAAYQSFNSAVNLESVKSQRVEVAELNA